MAMDPAKRCVVCGRPIPGSGEPLLPREVECQGCDAEIKAGATVAEARASHQAREVAAYEAIIKVRRERVAAGFSAVDGVTPLQDFRDEKGNDVTVAMMKARARAALDAQEAVEAAAREVA